jgi:hypothetical protein
VRLQVLSIRISTIQSFNVTIFTTPFYDTIVNNSDVKAEAVCKPEAEVEAEAPGGSHFLVEGEREVEESKTIVLLLLLSLTIVLWILVNYFAFFSVFVQISILLIKMLEIMFLLHSTRGGCNL